MVTSSISKRRRGEIVKNRKGNILVALFLCVTLLFSGYIKSASAEHDSETFAVGSYITFATYPQTADGTDETPIEWLVLDRDGESPSKSKSTES